MRVVKEVSEKDILIYYTEKEKYGKVRAGEIPVLSKATKGCKGAILEDSDELKDIYLNNKKDGVIKLNNQNVNMNRIVDTPKGNGRLSYGIIASDDEMKKIKRKKTKAKKK